MREIKFRAWDKEYNKMIFQHDMNSSLESKEYFFSLKGEGIELLHYDEDYSAYVKHDSELMQYTGIKDKNGKEIYEGDIFISDNNNKYEVAFIDGGFKLSNMKYPNQNLGLLDRMTSNYGKVIGNIYENEDLLEK